jgi:hypothetical protein
MAKRAVFVHPKGVDKHSTTILVSSNTTPRLPGLLFFSAPHLSILPHSPPSLLPSAIAHHIIVHTIDCVTISPSYPPLHST